MGGRGWFEGPRGHWGHPRFSQGVPPIPRARRGRRVLPRARPGPIFPVSTNPQTRSVFGLYWGDLLWERGPKGDGGKGSSVFWWLRPGFSWLRSWSWLLPLPKFYQSKEAASVQKLNWMARWGICPSQRLGPPPRLLPYSPKSSPAHLRGGSATWDWVLVMPQLTQVTFAPRDSASLPTQSISQINFFKGQSAAEWRARVHLGEGGYSILLFYILCVSLLTWCKNKSGFYAKWIKWGRGSLVQCGAAEPLFSRPPAPWLRLVGAEASAFQVGVIDRYTFIKKEEGKTISDSLITTGTKMTRTPSNETILFSFNWSQSVFNE